MKQRAYSIVDSKSRIWTFPFPARTDEEALRMAQQGAMNPESMYHQYPEDFTLFWVGYFNQDTGDLEPPKDNIKVNLGLFSHFLALGQEEENEDA